MDYGKSIGVEFRGIKDITHKGQPARSVTASRLYLTEALDLWDALTNPERIPRWFLPITGDLRAGGQYQFQGHAGGTITRCKAPEVLEATWEYGENTSWITVTLIAEGPDTKLTLEHVMLKDDDGEAHWKQYGPGATGVGWELSFLALGYHVTKGGIKIDPQENEAWMVSDAGKAFIRTAAKGWGEAHIHSGESADIARGMADLTAKFYTGE